MRIKEAKYDGDYRVIVEFDDGKIVEVDFEQFLFTARNSMSKQFLDKSLFSRVAGGLRQPYLDK